MSLSEQKIHPELVGLTGRKLDVMRILVNNSHLIIEPKQKQRVLKLAKDIDDNENNPHASKLRSRCLQEIQSILRDIGADEHTVQNLVTTLR